VRWIAAALALTLAIASVATQWFGAGMNLPWGGGLRHLCVYASSGRLWLAVEEFALSPPRFEAWGPDGNYIVHDWDFHPGFAVLAVPLWIPAALAAVVAWFGFRNCRPSLGHCRKCGHLLAGSTACPECGRSAPPN
jgi:hypothetical protein